jgi:exopolysaccharide biosynthesis WecB/TagA/CpsF family protein
VSTTRVRIFYPADPVGVVPGGIDTFLRGLIKWAPDDLDFSLVGMTTDPSARPLGRWTRCGTGGRDFNFHPVVAVGNAGGRGRVPLSVRFSLGTWRAMERLRSDFDIFDFHRPEPSLLFREDQRPKNAYFHQDPKIVQLEQSDNLWKHLPRVYARIERTAMYRFDSAWCVRESGVQTLRERYPAMAGRVRFIPTWVDADVFHPIDATERLALRRGLAQAHGLDEQAQWIITVGRLDTQKDPMLMMQAFARLCAQGRRVAWLAIGDGVLRPELEKRLAAAGLAGRVHLLGLRPPAEIAQWLRSSDVYALSSAYEGMPMALLEGLGCGLPAAVTDVGEVRRVVRTGVNGAIAAARDDEAFAHALALVLDGARSMGGAPALAAVEPFQPAKVLAPAYDNYRRLGNDITTVRRMARANHAADDPERARRAVVGVPIDLLDRVGASRRIVAWALERQSRTMCFVNVHSAIQATRDERHRLALLSADVAAPDGAPIAWSLRMKGNSTQQRVDGPGMMWRLCTDAQAAEVSIGLYGSTPDTLQALVDELHEHFPHLEVGYVYSPPFRELSAEEDHAVCEAIARSGVGILFVGLGCPKQEYWMACHRGRIPAVMLGVGAAFEFHAGTVSRAPEWMREHGLEWLHRLSTHPRRLWRRYLYSNSMFLAKSAREAATTVAVKIRSRF